jgi:hypothetical protein
MVMFWDAMLPNISKTQKLLFGGVIILYAVLRFSRILKRGRDEI